jgi:hypothetical protein
MRSSPDLEPMNPLVLSGTELDVQEDNAHLRTGSVQQAPDANGSQMFGEPEEDQPGQSSWAIDVCNICQAQDSTEHGFVTCPPIKHLWSQAVDLLPSLLHGHQVTPLQHANLSTRNIILAFPELRASLPKHQRARIILWHSAVIYTISRIRTSVIWRARRTATKTKFDWGDPEGQELLAKVKFEIRNLLWLTFIKSCGNKTITEIHNFENQWCSDNVWFSLSKEGEASTWGIKFHQ